MMSATIENFQRMDELQDHDHPVVACPAAFACLKIMQLILVDTVRRFEAMLTLKGTELHEVLTFLFRSGPEKIQEMLHSGWPIFALLSKIERLSVDYYSMYTGIIASAPMWERWKEDGKKFDAHVEDFEHVPLTDSVDLMVRLKKNEPGDYGQDRFAWSVAMASAHLAFAESIRHVDPALVGGPSVLSQQIHAALEYLKPVIQSITDGYIPPMMFFSSGWPIFRLLDRLASAPVSRVPMHNPAAAVPSYEAHLFPFHEKVSDFVRACGVPYCDQIFIELLMAVERSVNRTVWLIEIGANLGDCSLFAMAHT